MEKGVDGSGGKVVFPVDLFHHSVEAGDGTFDDYVIFRFDLLVWFMKRLISVRDLKCLIGDIILYYLYFLIVYLLLPRNTPHYK